MKLRNPKFVSPVAAIVANRKAAVQAFLDANAGDEMIDFAVIRASFPAGQRAELTDGALHEICKALGVEVLP
jgi:hypothetical protein